MGLLVDARGCAVGIGDRALGQWRRHGDVAAGEIGVEVLACLNGETVRRRLAESGDDRIDVLRTALAGLDDQRQVGRQRAAIARAGGFFIGKRRREVICGDARTGQALAFVVGRLAFVVRIGRNLVAGGDCLALRFAEANTAATLATAQIVERDAIEAVTGGADFLVDLETTLHGRAVICAERTVERKAHILGRHRLAEIDGLRVCCSRQGQERSKGERERFHIRHPHSAGLSTGCAMEAGSGFGVSMRPSSGMISQKKPK